MPSSEIKQNHQSTRTTSAQYVAPNAHLSSAPTAAGGAQVLQAAARHCVTSKIVGLVASAVMTTSRSALLQRLVAGRGTARSSGRLEHALPRVARCPTASAAAPDLAGPTRPCQRSPWHSRPAARSGGRWGPAPAPRRPPRTAGRTPRPPAPQGLIT